MVKKGTTYKLEFEFWRVLVSQVLKDKCIEAVERQIQQNIVGNSSPAPSRPTLKVESVASMIEVSCVLVLRGLMINTVYMLIS